MKQRIRHTTIITTSHQGEKIPLILNLHNSNYSNLAMLYIKLIKKQEKSLKALSFFTNYISYLFDYYYETKPKNIKEKRIFLEKYTNSLKEGNILNWQTSTNKKRQDVFKNTKDFIEFSIQHKELANKEETHFINTLIEATNFSKNIPNSQFLKKYLRKYEINRTIKRSFPTHKIMELIQNKENYKYKLLYSLMAFGGVSSTKCLHLLKEDVKIENNRLKVTIAHPSKSLIKGITREEYLKQYNLTPRHKANKKLYIPWRNPKYQYPEKLESEIVFIGEIESYLIEWHKKYIQTRKDNNPYYFIGKTNALTHGHFMEKFHRDCRDIGLGKEEGVSPQGLRFFYGYYLTKVLEIDSIFVQRLMGYTDIRYAQTYTIDKINNYKQIQKIQEKI